MSRIVFSFSLELLLFSLLWLLLILLHVVFRSSHLCYWFKVNNKVERGAREQRKSMPSKEIITQCKTRNNMQISSTSLSAFRIVCCCCWDELEFVTKCCCSVAFSCALSNFAFGLFVVVVVVVAVGGGVVIVVGWSSCCCYCCTFNRGCNMPV